MHRPRSKPRISRSRCSRTKVGGGRSETRNFYPRYDCLSYQPIASRSPFALQYDRIDPAEMQLLKDEIAQLQSQNLELKAVAEKQATDTAAQQVKVRGHP